MFDLRYHVASLVAVFLMLVVGILVGVGISGRGFVDDAERDRFNDRIAKLQEQVDAADASTEDLRAAPAGGEDFVESAYPVLADRRLDGKHIAVLVVGSVGPTLDFVERALRDSDAGAPIRMRAVKVPLRLDAIESTLLTGPELGGYVGEPNLGNLGRDLGRELATGGPDAALGRALAQPRRGALGRLARARRRRRRDPRRRSPSRGRPRASSPGSTPAWAARARPPSGSSRPASSRARSRSSSATGSRRSTGSTRELGRLALVLLLGGACRATTASATPRDGILPPIEPLPSG